LRIICVRCLAESRREDLAVDEYGSEELEKEEISKNG